MGIDAHVNPLWADLSSTGTITTRYFTGDIPGSNNTNSVLARSQVNGGSTAPAWLGTDRQGSVRDILDPTSGNLQDSITYSAFGAITSQSNASWTGSITYTGLIFDNNSGMLFAKYRALNPATGQWLSEDPLGLTAGDPNVRRYAGNNTENAQDGSGLRVLQKKFDRAEFLREYLRSLNVRPDAVGRLYWEGDNLFYNYRIGGSSFVGIYSGVGSGYKAIIKRWVSNSSGAPYLWEVNYGKIVSEATARITTSDWDNWFQKNGR